MVQYPSVLVRAQAELDSIVGTTRLPTFSDRPNLPYCEAVYEECLRWAAVVPLGQWVLFCSDLQAANTENVEQAYLTG